MKKEENVVRYYVLCNKLKNTIRSGWKIWNVKKERLESVAEHIFGVQMLAIAMKSEFKYDVDIMKIIMMLAVHELEEIYIGDLTSFEITDEKRKIKGHKAVSQIIGNLLDKKQIIDLIKEFDDKKTKEALFAFWCDKLECDLQSKLYDEEGLVDLNDQKENKVLENNDVKELLKDGNSWSSMWLLFGQKKYNYDENFIKVSNYAKNNNILKFMQNDSRKD